MGSSNLLVIFTRNPKLGKVKTRLAKDVGDEAALEIYKFLLEHTVRVTKDLDVHKVVYYSEEVRENDLWDNKTFSKKLQQGKHLGVKMMNAFEEGFREGYEKIVIIGSDLYELSPKDLERAFAALEEKDFVLGPAEDGGYYLLGMTKMRPEIFQNKKWSTSTVLSDTLKDLEGEKVALLKEKNDVDHYEDIKDHADFQQFLKNMNKSIP